MDNSDDEKKKKEEEKKQLEEGLELSIQFEKRGGSVPTIAQDYNSGRILLLTDVNPEGFQKTLDTGIATFWNTPRNILWTKDESKDIPKTKKILVDCDQDALIYKIERLGKKAMESCFSETDNKELELVKFGKEKGLVQTIAQDYRTNKILMLAYVNAEALKKTWDIGLATFWSTSRNELWTKGKTSGDGLEMIGILMDCNKDALVYQVKPLGNGACHTKNLAGKARESCFFREVLDDNKLKYIDGMQ
jgi:phosphoribosyl-AMP cyclohydrolase